MFKDVLHDSSDVRVDIPLSCNSWYMKRKQVKQNCEGESIDRHHPT